MTSTPPTRRSVPVADHVGLTVADLDAGVAFFRDVLGFVERRRSHTVGQVAADITGVPGAEIDHAFVVAGELEIELLAYRTPAPTSRTAGPGVPGSMHLALRVDDVHGVVHRAAAHGWTPPGRPWAMTSGPRAGSVMTYLRDASGSTLELIGPA